MLQKGSWLRSIVEKRDRGHHCGIFGNITESITKGEANLRFAVSWYMHSLSRCLTLSRVCLNFNYHMDILLRVMISRVDNSSIFLNCSVMLLLTIDSSQWTKSAIMAKNEHSILSNRSGLVDLLLANGRTWPISTFSWIVLWRTVLEEN